MVLKLRDVLRSCHDTTNIQVTFGSGKVTGDASILIALLAVDTLQMDIDYMTCKSDTILIYLD